MPYYKSSQEWLHQSALLLEARPNTTHITTTYHQTDKISTSRKRQIRREQQRRLETTPNQPTSTTTTTATTTAVPRASLTLKTYDPHTGTCLKYRTTKAAEVSRLILSLGQLGKKMAALPTDNDISMPDVPAPEDVVIVSGTEGAANGNGNGNGKGPTQTPQPGGNAKGKKKRSKK
ncbi:signal recognition particle 9 kDa protein-domain-containing protein [Xylaria sp. CBS 124048]|nr:signal recognition particle 9 kDa protein-domain-containing protein [Xylaria sp. CBS 124048]